MSKMGEAIIAMQDTVDSYRYLGFDECMSIVNQQHGPMFTAIAEEYYGDYSNFESAIMYSEIHDVEEYEQLLKELEEEGVI